MTKPQPLTSPLKYPGGKRKLFPEVERRLPAGRFKYAEPFWGGGSIGVRLAGEGRATQIVAGEACPPVRAFWEALVQCPLELKAVLKQLAERFQMRNAQDVFQEMRERVNQSLARTGTRELPLSVEGLGGRLLALNKTCMNGLVRFNAAGEFNVPIGRRQDGSFYRFNPDFEHLDRVRAALVGANFEIYPSWKEALREATALKLLGREPHPVVIYLDPPYTGGFVDYTAEGWSSDDDIQLYEASFFAGKELGCRVILSQPDTEWALDCCSSILRGWQVEIGRAHV